MVDEYLRHVDANKDGVISKEEFAAYLNEVEKEVASEAKVAV